MRRGGGGEGDTIFYLKLVGEKPWRKLCLTFLFDLLQRGIFFPWISQLAIPGSKLTIETLEQGVNYVFKLTIKTPEGRSGVFIVNF